ncbi:peptidase inhibitor family I36 protein [Mycetocola sp. JXN-3]|uniref:peptidase inhibitor family I36 protein n=1 Tax=Mycetocola sp. JXN-3 TaxID=2116510 RepID=UPI00165D17E7|nr:peptidase inhibitor family I36 protein [Mycetocola sp. JXN-3]
MRFLRTSLAAAALTLLALSVPSIASAQGSVTDSMQARVDTIIAAHGGVQTAWNEITWDGGDVIATLGAESAASARSFSALSVGNCASGRYCAYSSLNFGGDRLTYSACPATNTSLSAIGTVRSISNNRGSGTVRAYAGTTLKNTISTGSGASSTSGITRITCS